MAASGMATTSGMGPLPVPATDPGTPTAARTPNLVAALDLSARMVAAAEAAQWDQVASLQIECTRELRHPWPVTAANRDALRTLKEQHQRVMTLGAAARARVADELHALRRGQQVANIYLEAGDAD